MNNAFAIRFAAALVALVFSGGLTARAGDATWTWVPSGLPYKANWSTGSNWNTGMAPGSTTTTNNTDTATIINGTPPATIIIDQPNQNIGNIVFGPNSNYVTISSIIPNFYPLLLSSGGSITDNLSGPYTTDVNVSIILEPVNATSNGTYTFANYNSYASSSSNLSRDFPFDLMFKVFKWLFPTFS